MLRDRSGMALVLTLLTVSFLVAVTVQLGTSVNWQLQAAANQRKNVQLDAMLMSGLNLARAALLADQQENDFDSAFDTWGEFQPDTLAALVTTGSLDIKVEDLSGGLQVNALVLSKEDKKKLEQDNRAPGQRNKPKKDPEKMQRNIWKRFLTSGYFAVEDEDAAAELLDSLVDWLDEDDEERDNGAERGYYTSQNPSYEPANGPLLLPDELLLIKGWNRQLLYGDKEHSGIIDYLTIAGRDGKININTAPSRILQALSPDITPELADDLIAFRAEEANKDTLAGLDWYHQVSGFPGDITIDRELITTTSNSFKITVTARIDKQERIGTGVLLRRDSQEQELLYWKVD